MAKPCLCVGGSNKDAFSSTGRATLANPSFHGTLSTCCLSFASEKDVFSRDDERKVFLDRKGMEPGKEW